MATTSVRTQRNIPAVWIAAAIAVAVLLIDDYTSQDMPPQFLYVLCVLVSVWAPRERTIWAVAALCSFLTVLGSYLSPPSFELAVILFNRVTAIVLIWLTAVLVWQYRRTHDQLLLLNQELEARVEDRTRDLARAFEEREQLNRDLHDNVLQSLYAVGLKLEAHQPSGPTGMAGADGYIQQALRQLKSVMQQIRTYIAGPQPASDDQQSLDLALSSLVHSMTLAQGPRLGLSMEPGLSEGLSREQAESILLIVRESLSNCVRHSRARQGWVSAQKRNGTLRVEIQDDGVGFHADAPRATGHGLANMAARAKAIGAEFEIRSSPDHGVHIELALPLQPEGLRP